VLQEKFLLSTSDVRKVTGFKVDSITMHDVKEKVTMLASVEDNHIAEHAIVEGPKFKNLSIQDAEKSVQIVASTTSISANSIQGARLSNFEAKNIKGSIFVDFRTTAGNKDNKKEQYYSP